MKKTKTIKKRSIHNYLMKEKTKNLLLVITFLVIIVVSLFLAYENGVIGKAIVESVTG